MLALNVASLIFIRTAMPLARDLPRWGLLTVADEGGRGRVISYHTGFPAFVMSLHVALWPQKMQVLERTTEVGTPSGQLWGIHHSCWGKTFWCGCSGVTILLYVTLSPCSGSKPHKLIGFPKLDFGGIML